MRPRSTTSGDWVDVTRRLFDTSASHLAPSSGHGRFSTLVTCVGERDSALTNVCSRISRRSTAVWPDWGAATANASARMRCCSSSPHMSASATATARSWRVRASERTQGSNWSYRVLRRSSCVTSTSLPRTDDRLRRSAHPMAATRSHRAYRWQAGRGPFLAQIGRPHLPPHHLGSPVAPDDASNA